MKPGNTGASNALPSYGNWPGLAIYRPQLHQTNRMKLHTHVHSVVAEDVDGLAVDSGRILARQI